MDSRAEALKKQGNLRFQQGDFTAAENYYSSALVADPSAPSLYTNRARCRLNLKQYEAAISDCEACLALDPKNTKANYLMAKARLEAGDYDGACASARVAYDLCRLHDDERRSLDMTLQLLLQCRRARWDRMEKARRREAQDLEREVLDLLDKDRGEALAAAEGDLEREEIERESRGKRELMASIFERARADDDRKRELPEWLIDDISFNVMVDPVITKTGRSYERSSVMAHLRNHPVDPLTREPLTVEELRPNIALKQACEWYLENNGWAYDW